jgi:hypothetical protein
MFYPHDPTLRCELSGGKVAAYSSASGIVLALRLLQMGGHWWPDYRLYAKHYLQLRGNSLAVGQELYGYHFPPRIHVDYHLTGGLWVLKTTQDDGGSEYAPQVDPEDPSMILPLDRFSEGWESSIYDTRTMDERCQVIKHYGGRWYASVAECPDLPSTLHEGVQRGKNHEKFL